MVKKVRKFNYQKDRKKEMRKKKAKKNPSVNSEQLKGFWDPKKTILQNYQNLGISADPNKSLVIPSTKSTMIPDEIMNIEQAKQLSKAQKCEMEVETPAVKKLIKDSKQGKEKKYEIGENDSLFCIYMIEKYGDNYEKMERDYKNMYQETARQIEKKIQLFKSNKKQYGKYVVDKKAGLNFLNKLDEKF